jgi:uncharacterized protein (TIGR04552 family)
MATDKLSQPPPPLFSTEVSLFDVEALRLLLKGQSVIDWQRLELASEEEVDRFLRVNEFDPERDDDMNRLEELRDEAVEYLSRSLAYQLPEEVTGGMPVRDLFMLASSRGRGQPAACVVLKAMHVLHHLAGRQLLFKLPISEEELFVHVERKVVRVVEELRAAGLPIVEFAWSRKELDSIITKLLAKKESIAANVFDKLRFRLVTRTRADLPVVLNELLHRLVPFNYVIPGQTVNGVLPVDRLIRETPAFARHAARLQVLRGGEAAESLGNEFSGPTYRVINFVADLPVRIDDLLCRMPDNGTRELGSIVFILTEFQVVDAEMARHNEEGDNSHHAYKLRQLDRVRARLGGTTPPDPAGAGDEDDDE